LFGAAVELSRCCGLPTLAPVSAARSDAPAFDGCAREIESVREDGSRSVYPEHRLLMTEGEIMRSVSRDSTGATARRPARSAEAWWRLTRALNLRRRRRERAGESIAGAIMLELKVGDRVRSREDDMRGAVMRREHDFRASAVRHRLGRWRTKRDLAERGSRFGRTLELWRPR
jgi:hypothetical protein